MSILTDHSLLPFRGGSDDVVNIFGIDDLVVAKPKRRPRIRLNTFVRLIEPNPAYPPGMVVSKHRVGIEGKRMTIYQIGYLGADNAVHAYGASTDELMIDDGEWVDAVREPSIGNLHFRQPLPLP